MKRSTTALTGLLAGLSTVAIGVLAGCGTNTPPSSTGNNNPQQSQVSPYIYTGTDYKWESVDGGYLTTYIYYDRNTHVEYAETVNSNEKDIANNGAWASFYPVYGSNGQPIIYKGASN